MSKACPCVYFDNGKCKKFSDEKYTSWCAEEACGDKTPSNADRIRAMTDEELAEFIPYWSYTNACKCGKHYDDCNNECEKCVAEWLQQPAEEVADRA